MGWRDLANFTAVLFLLAVITAAMGWPEDRLKWLITAWGWTIVHAVNRNRRSVEP